MFKISTSSRYGIRALLEMAKHDINIPLNLGDIARNQNISIKYLESIFKLFKNNNIVKSTRGPGGGYRLAKTPGELDLYTILVAINGPLTTIDCVADPAGCVKTGVCNARLFWQEFQEHIITFLQSRTLQDILEAKPGIAPDWYAAI